MERVVEFGLGRKDIGSLRSQHLGIETRETNGKYSTQLQNGRLHKVNGLLRATPVHGEEREKIEWARQDRGGDGEGFPLPKTDRVARLSGS